MCNTLTKEESLLMHTIDNRKFYIVQVYGKRMEIIKETVVTGAELDETIRFCRASVSWKMIAIFDNGTKQAVSLIRQ